MVIFTPRPISGLGASWHVGAAPLLGGPRRSAASSLRVECSWRGIPGFRVEQQIEADSLPKFNLTRLRWWVTLIPLLGPIPLLGWNSMGKQRSSAQNDKFISVE